MPPIERCLLRLEDAPWHAVYRSAIGFLFVPAFHWLFGRKASLSSFLICLAAVLFALRLGPALLRRVWRFSTEAQQQWALKRYWAKLYDSYQWQKLLWIGLGLAAGAVWVKRLEGYEMVVAGLCLAGGALGLIFWQARRKQLVLQQQ